MNNLNFFPAKPEKTVLVLGAAGRLGLAATKAFVHAGWTVWAQARKPIQGLPRGRVKVLQADVLEIDRIIESCGKVDVIVHAINPDYARWDLLLPPITAAVLHIAKALNAHVMIPGNVYNFGQELPEMLDEGTAFVANTEKASQRIQMEASFSTAADELGVSTVVIRAGDFIGGRGTWLDMGITKNLHKAVFTTMGPGHLPHAWAYLPDLAKVFVLVAEKREVLPRFDVLHFPGYRASQLELQSAFEQLMGHPLKVKPMPWGLMKMIAWFSPMLKAVLKMRYLWERPHQLSGDKLLRLIGPIPHTPLKLALREYLPKNKKSQPRALAEISIES